MLADFSPAVADAIHRALREPKNGRKRKVATFDADGTLWDRDIGEAFMRWLVVGDLLPQYRGRADLYQEYEARVAKNRTEGYAWAVQVMAGLPADTLALWCRQFVHAWPNYRAPMLTLVKELTACDVEVWIVSATCRPLVQAAAPLVGIPVERTLGIETRVQGGVLTDELVQPVTSEQGKVVAIEQHIGVRPALAFGDSMGDFPMLCHAVQPIVVAETRYANAKLLEHAAQKQWPVQMF